MNSRLAAAKAALPLEFTARLWLRTALAVWTAWLVLLGCVAAGAWA